MPNIGLDGSVTSSALESVNEFSNSIQNIYSENTIYEGQITQIYAVDDSQNVQSGEPGTYTVYDVLIRTSDGGTQTVTRARALQPLFGGGFNNFMEVLPTDPGPQGKTYIDTYLKRGSRVLVAFAGGQRASAVIIGAMPHDNPVANKRRPSKSKGSYLEMEFQGLNVSIDNDGALKIVFNSPRNDSGAPMKSDAAPTVMNIDNQGNVIVSTNASQELKIDRVAKNITLTNGGTKILMDANSTLIQTDSKDVKINATAKCEITTGADTKIKAGGKVTLDAPEINFNGSAGPVLTELTDPIIDYIYGAPTEGVKTVKAG